MLDLIKKIFGKAAPQPTGKTGNQWTESDFAAGESTEVVSLASEFAQFCITKGSCDLNGEVLDKLVSVIRRFPATSDDDDADDEYDPQSHFSVIVRDKLIAAGLVPKGDPNRYQYKLSMMFIHYGDEG